MDELTDEQVYELAERLYAAGRVLRAVHEHNTDQLIAARAAEVAKIKDRYIADCRAALKEVER